MADANCSDQLPPSADDSRSNSASQNRAFSPSESPIVQQTLDRLQFITQAAQLYWWDWDLLTNQTTYSPNTEQIIGRPPAQSLQENLQLLHPDDRPLSQQALEQAQQEGTDAFHYQVRSIAMPTQLKYLQVSGQLYRDEQRRVVRVIGVTQDITARKLAELALQENQQQQTFLLHLSDTLRTLADPVRIQQAAMQLLGQYLHVSRAFYGDMQADQDTLLIGPGYAGDTFPLELQVRFSEFEADLSAYYGKGQTVVMEDVNEHPLVNDQSKAEFALIDCRAAVGVPLLKEGRVRAILSLHQRVPRQWTAIEIGLAQETAERTWAAVERAKAEETLRQSEEKYRTLFNSIDEAVTWLEVIFDENEKVIDWRMLETNPATTKMTGWTSEVIGKKASEYIPGDIEPFWFDAVEHVAKTGQPLRVAHPVAGLNDNWYEMYLARVGGEESHQIVVVYNNITERKRQEANLAFLVEVSRDLVKLTTMDETLTALGAKIGGHFRVSRCAFCELNESMDEAVVNYDWHQDDELSLVGRYRLADFYTDELLQILRAGVALVVSDSQTDSRVHAQSLAALNIGSYLVIPLVRDGQLRFALCIYDAKARSWRDDEINLMSELTSRIWAQLERTRAEAALRDVDQRKDEFLAMLAHELRNPLAPVRNGLQLLAQTHQEDQLLGTLLPMMSRQMDHLLRMLNDLLDVSRISQGKIELQNERIDLTQVIAQAVDAMRPLYTASDRQLSAQLPNYPLYLEGDRTRLNQVVTNLLTNSLRYTHKGGKAWLSLTQLGEQALLRVRDNGIGLAPDQLESIFELFVQVDNSLGRSYGGLGLGLSLVQDLVSRHGGRVEARSPGLEQGSEFVVYLPILSA